MHRYSTKRGRELGTGRQLIAKLLSEIVSILGLKWIKLILPWAFGFWKQVTRQWGWANQSTVWDPNVWSLIYFQCTRKTKIVQCPLKHRLKRKYFYLRIYRFKLLPKKWNQMVVLAVNRLSLRMTAPGVNTLPSQDNHYWRGNGHVWNYWWRNKGW